VNKFATFIFIYFRQCLQGFCEIGKELLKINLQGEGNLIRFICSTKAVISLKKMTIETQLFCRRHEFFRGVISPKIITLMAAVLLFAEYL